MKLRSKVLFILGVGLVGLSSSFYLASSLLLGSSYAKLENQQVSQDVQRILDALSEEVDSISRSALDYGKWDETYQFIVNKNTAYVESSFGAYIEALQMNAIVYLDTSNTVIFSLGADLLKAKGAPVSPGLLNQLASSSLLTNHNSPSSEVSGIIQLPEGPMMVGSRPITTTAGEGPIRGTVVMGRYLNSALLKAIEERTKSPNLSLEPFDGTQLPPDFRTVKRILMEEGLTIVVRPIDEKTIAGYALIKDINGKPAFLLRMVEPRDIYGQGQASLNYLVLSILVVGSVFSVAILLFLEKSILSRLDRLSMGVSQIGSGGVPDERVCLSGRDELTDLANTFNLTLNQLEQFQTSLQESAGRLQRHNTVIAQLSRNESLLQGNLKQATRAFTQATAATLNIDRVSIWLYNTDQSQIECIDLYEYSTDIHTEGFVLRVVDFPSYFQALARDGLVDTPDAQTDPRTIELAQPYLIPLNIVSMLDFPIQVGGRTMGVICCEQIATRRAWHPEEQNFIYSIASLVSLALESETLQREVGHLLNVVSSVGEGDLTVEAQVSSRITGLVADTFNQLIEHLAHILEEVLNAARQVTDRANQQKGLAEVVATNTEQQARDAMQVLALAEQVEQAAQESAEQTQASNQSLQTVSTTVALGQEAIATLTQSIFTLQEGTDRIVQQMKTLGEFVGLADQFVQDQSQIAFITQTLALNASLVAARASEQRDPRQFVVVAREFDSIADQVGKLAQQTSESLTTIEQRSAQIHSIVSAVDADVQGLGELVRQFTHGVEQSNQVFSHVQKVTAEAVYAGEQVAQFSQKIEEAAQSTADVMRDIAELATQTAEMTQISRERSDQIDILAVHLLQSVQFFRLPDPNLSSPLVQPFSEVELTTIEVEPDSPSPSPSPSTSTSPSPSSSPLPELPLSHVSHAPSS